MFKHSTKPSGIDNYFSGSLWIGMCVCVIQPINPDCISALPGDVRMVGVLLSANTSSILSNCMASGNFTLLLTGILTKRAHKYIHTM